MRIIYSLIRNEEWHIVGPRIILLQSLQQLAYTKRIMPVHHKRFVNIGPREQSLHIGFILEGERGC